MRVPQLTVIETTSPAKTKVIVNKVALAHFLNQDKLVMQIGEHEIQFAEYHRWAEPLAKEITQLIVRELNTRSENFEFIKLPACLSQEISLQLNINIDKFHSTDMSLIILSGDFWITKNNKPTGMSKSFDITDNLTQDGYLHSVKKLQQAIATLSLQIVNFLNMEQDSLCVNNITQDSSANCIHK